MSDLNHPPIHKGSCLCGKVKMETYETLAPVIVCHCSDCRKFTGHIFASTEVSKKSLKISGEESIKWYQFNEKVRRGFCENCGSSLFWEPLHHDWTAISMGVFDTPTHTELEKHIWVSDKGDYYDINDDFPKFEY